MTITLTLWHVFAALIALAGGAGTLGALIAAGVAQRYVKPIVEAELARHDADAATQQARQAVVLRVVEDHLRRDDGMIRLRLDAQDTRLHEALEDVRETVTRGLAETREQLAEIKGLLAATPRITRAPTPPHGLTPQPPRRPGG